jgi:hypothetical protein
MRKTPYILVIIAFLANTFGPFPAAQAQEFRLPAPGVRVGLSPDFSPLILKGIKVRPNNPFRFDFIVDQGDSSFSSPEATKLIKYFLASLTIPEKDLWVNLSPYEKDKIIPQSFGQTEMGRDLLAEDYMLKQITASLIYPEGETGRKFWKRIYEEAAKKFGTTNVPVNTFNKVWIIPEKAVVYENAKAGTAYVVESKLKVMLEQDYLSMSKHIGRGVAEGGASPASAGFGEHAGETRGQAPDMNKLGSDIVREIVLPELTREVNEDKNFSQLRQVYNSLILATWYKKKIRDSILEQVYADKKKIAGVGFKNSINVQAIYQRYLQAFKKGVYNYIKEEQDPLTLQLTPRKYFSGGASFNMEIAYHETADPAMLSPFAFDHAMVVSANINPADEAMMGRSMWGEPLPQEDEVNRDQLIGLINADVKKAYDYASREFTGDQTGGIWAAGACRLINNFLFNTFKGRSGINIKVVRYRTENRLLKYDADFHDFIIIFFNGRVWILDPTWQQFLKQGEFSEDHPKILLVDVARLDEKLDAMKVLKDNRHYWYSGLLRDTIVMERIHQEGLYRAFSPHVPQYYVTARSKLTPQGLFRFIQKSIDAGQDLPALDIFDSRVRMYSLSDQGFESLLAILNEGMEKAPVQIRSHFEIARNYYLQVRQDRIEARPVTDVFDFVFKLFKEKLLAGHHGLIAESRPSIMVGKKRINVDVMGLKPDSPLFLRVGGIIFYNENYQGFIGGIDEKFLGLHLYPLLNNHFPMSGASLDAVITSIAGLWAIKNTIQSRTVIDFRAGNEIAGVVAKKLGAQDVILIGENDEQDKINQIPFERRGNAVVLMNAGGESDIEKYILPIKPSIIITAGGIAEYARMVQETLGQAGYSSQTISGLTTTDRKPFVAFLANEQVMGGQAAEKKTHWIIIPSRKKTANYGDYKDIFDTWMADLINSSGNAANPIFLMSGDLGAGKTTMAKFFKAFLAEHGHSAVVIHTDDFVDTRSFRFKLYARSLISNILYVNQEKRLRLVNRIYAANQYRDAFWHQIESLKDPQQHNVRLVTPREQFSVNAGTIIIMEGPHTRNLFPSLVPAKAVFFQISPSLQKQRITDRIMEVKGDTFLYASIKARLPKPPGLLSEGVHGYDYFINVDPDGNLTMSKTGKPEVDSAMYATMQRIRARGLWEDRVNALVKANGPDMFYELEEIIENTEPAKGVATIEILSERQDRIRFLRIFLAGIKSKFRFVRLASVKAAEKVNDSRANEILMRAVSDPDTRISMEALKILEKMGREEDIPGLLRIAEDLPEEELFYIYDDHGATVAYTRPSDEKNRTTDRLILKGPQTVPNFLKDKILEVISSIKNRWIELRRSKRIEMSDVQDQLFKDFMGWLKENHFEDILVFGGGVRDALIGRQSSDFDITVAVPLTDAEYIHSLSTRAQASKKITLYVRKRLEALAKALNVPVENFFDPAKQVLWRGREIQYSGPIQKKDAEGQPVYIKRALVDSNSLGLFSSSSGPSILQMAVDVNGQLYGHVEAINDLSDQMIRIIGNLKDVNIGMVMRIVRLQCELGLQLTADDELAIRRIVKEYIAKRLYEKDPFLKEVVIIKQLNSIAKIVREKRSLIDPLSRLEELGMVELIQDHLHIDLKQFFAADQAMLEEKPGGIDLTPARMNLQTNGNGIRFHLDPAMLQKLQNAPGFVPVIINIQPMADLRTFLGINDPVGVDKSA